MDFVQRQILTAELVPTRLYVESINFLLYSVSMGRLGSRVLVHVDVVDEVDVGLYRDVFVLVADDVESC